MSIVHGYEVSVALTVPVDRFDVEGVRPVGEARR